MPTVDLSLRAEAPRRPPSRATGRHARDRRADLLQPDRANRATRSLLALGLILLLCRPGLRDRLRPERRPGGRRRAIGHRRSSSAASLSLGSYFAGRQLVLAASGAKEVTEDECAAALQRRPRADDRGEHPDAQGLHHRRHRSERVRHRPRSAARLDRDHTGLLRSSTARSSRASSATSCRTSATSTSGSRCSSACWSAASPSWPTSSCASRSGAAAAGRSDSDRGGGGAPADHLRRRDRPGDPGADRGPPGPARGQPPARVPGRRVGGRADPQPGRAGAGPGQDRGRHGGPRGRQPGDPAPVLHQPDQEVRRPARRARWFATHPPLVDRINRLRQLRGLPPVESPAEELASSQAGSGQ